MNAPILAMDIGGSKMLAALVRGAEVLDSRTIPTPRDAAPALWCDALAGLVADWSGRYTQAGLAVTGGIGEGRWFALNPATLPVPAGFPLVSAMRDRLGVPVFACNDAQAAAWGEYRHGAGRGRDLVFLTVSTGLGGGVVMNGRLLSGRSGLAGHVGQIRLAAPDGGRRLEDMLSGQAISHAAEQAGHPGSAAEVAGAADRGEAWADAILDASAGMLARALADLQLLFDPDVVVIGGGLGLNAGYRSRVVKAVAGLPDALRPDIVPAQLGANAGVIGIADLAQNADASRPSTGGDQT